MLPALQKRIPIRIRNTFNPSFTGTYISDQGQPESFSSVKGIASMEDVSLLKVTGEGILQTVGIAHESFGTGTKE